MKKKFTIDELAKELNVISLERQKSYVGGYDLPPVYCSASYPKHDASWMQWWYDQYNSRYNYPTPSAMQGGGYGGDTSGTNSTLSMEDPLGLTNKLDSFLKTTIAYIEKMIKEGNPMVSKTYLETLKSTQKTLESMKNNPNIKVFVEELVDANLNANNILDGYVTYSDEKKGFLFRIEGGDKVDSIDLIAHELTHIQQFMDGKTWIENGKTLGYDLTDEVEAYRNQHIIRHGSLASNYDLLGNPVPDGNYLVTAEEVLRCYPGIYDNLPHEETHYIAPPSYSSNDNNSANLDNSAGPR